MRSEYLLFDLFVLAPLVTIATWRPRWLPGFWRPALLATLLAAIPFVIWDACVADRHWWFAEAYTLGPRLFGLPVEELGFFAVVPLACLVTWELVLEASHPWMPARGFVATPAPARGRTHRIAVMVALVALLAAAWAWHAGREYTALALVGLVVAAAIDDALGTSILGDRRGHRLVLAVGVFTTVFNGYLTARPIVLYDPAYQIGLRVGSIPIEDYAFGLALVLVTTALYQWQRGRTRVPSYLAALIAARFGGYRHVFVAADPSLPERVSGRRRVAVIGGGLAGLGAAELLSRRGFEVVLIERNAYLGGKLAGWRERLPDGSEHAIEHGFHAFFRHYYNLVEWMIELGLHERMRPIEDYVILTGDRRRIGFAGADPTPGLNLLALASRGLYRLRDVMRPATGRELEIMLRYDADRPDPALDGRSFADFARAAQLPHDLQLVFNSFARAFFADEQRMSLQQLVKSFHFYYLSHDHGLIYDYLEGSYAELVDAIADRLRAQGVELRTGRSVGEIEPGADGLSIDGERFDHVVLATDAAAAARIAAGSPGLARAHGEFVARLGRQRAGQRYAVIRRWLGSAPSTGDLPVFVSTERARALDAVAFPDRTDPEAREWAARERGAVIELHCYAVPDDLPDHEIARAMTEELAVVLPELAAAPIRHEHIQIRADFTAFHVGTAVDRLGVVTPVPGLVLAGDWVELPTPAMLMEAAHTSARLAVAEICRHERVRGPVVWTVPRRGLLPARRVAEPAAK